MKKIITAAIILTLLPAFVQAEGFSAPSATAEKPPSDINFSAYLDTSYNHLQRKNIFSSDVFDRVYDLKENGFTLHQAAFTLGKQPKAGFGGLVNFLVGRDANTTAAYGMHTDTGKEFGFDLVQGYLQYATGSLTVIGGKFVSLAGAETINPTTDTNFSRSILFGFAEPATHTGFRGTYTLNEQFCFIAGVNNGWDSIRDTGRDPTLELGMVYNPDPLFSLAIQGYSGEQRVVDRTHSGPKGRRTLIDMVATVNPTDKLSLVANMDYATQAHAILQEGDSDRATWEGIAGYVNYKLTDQWRTSLRGEHFNDKKGYRTGITQRWKEITLTVGYSPISSLELRAETRRDFSNHDVFISHEGETIRDNNQSYALEAIYRFA